MSVITGVSPYAPLDHGAHISGTHTETAQAPADAGRWMLERVVWNVDQIADARGAHGPLRHRDTQSAITQLSRIT